MKIVLLSVASAGLDQFNQEMVDFVVCAVCDTSSSRWVQTAVGAPSDLNVAIWMFVEYLILTELGTDLWNLDCRRGVPERESWLIRLHFP